MYPAEEFLMFIIFSLEEYKASGGMICFSGSPLILLLCVDSKSVLSLMNGRKNRIVPSKQI